MALYTLTTPTPEPTDPRIAANAAAIAALGASQDAQDALIAANATFKELAAVKTLVDANVDNALTAVARQPDLSLLLTYEDGTTDTVEAGGASLTIGNLNTGDEFANAALYVSGAVDLVDQGGGDVEMKVRGFLSFPDFEGPDGANGKDIPPGCVAVVGYGSNHNGMWLNHDSDVQPFATNSTLFTRLGGPSSEVTLIDVDARNNTVYPFSTGETWAEIKANYRRLIFSGNASRSGIAQIRPWSLIVNLGPGADAVTQPGFQFDLHNYAGVSITAQLPSASGTGLRYFQSGGDAPTDGRMQFTVTAIR